MVGFLTTLLAFVCVVCPACKASSFCDKKKKKPYVISLHFIYCYLTQANLGFSDVRIEEYYSLDLCPNMINFDMDFSECHAEEVMLVFTLSVISIHTSPSF